MWILWALFALAVALALYGFARGYARDDIWNISLFAGASLSTLRPLGGDDQPLITSEFVTDAKASFVADPFLVPVESGWWLFFEFLNSERGRGELGVGFSSDLRHWKYEGRVLAEPHHLSYPQVIPEDGSHYLLPESGDAGVLRLYRAVRFPHVWEPVAQLLTGRYYDATVFQRDNRWWMFALRDGQELCLFHSAVLHGPWQEHPASPLTRKLDARRPAGRVIEQDGQLVRFSQDCGPTYGFQVFGWIITELTPTTYSEIPLPGGSVIGARGKGWNRDGMHHLDVHRGRAGGFVAAVDGKYIRHRFRWRKGCRAVADLAQTTYRLVCKRLDRCRA